MDFFWNPAVFLVNGDDQSYCLTELQLCSECVSLWQSRSECWEPGRISLAWHLPLWSAQPLGLNGPQPVLDLLGLKGQGVTVWEKCPCLSKPLGVLPQSWGRQSRPAWVTKDKGSEVTKACRLPLAQRPSLTWVRSVCTQLPLWTPWPPTAGVWSKLREPLGHVPSFCDKRKHTSRTSNVLIWYHKNKSDTKMHKIKSETCFFSLEVTANKNLFHSLLDLF